MTYREMESSVELAHIEHPEHDELLTLNLGPHHPATHGVLRLITTLEGEVVRDIKPVIGYVHTGIEKNCEDKSYWKVIPLVERMDYLSYYFNAMAYCGVRRDAAGHRRPAARAVPARRAHGAQPDRLAPAVARDRRAGPRRDVGLLVRLARPRPDPRPVRDVLRPAHAPALLPGRRRRRGHPGRLGEEGARVHQAVPGAHRPVRGADRQEPDRARAPARRRRRRRRHAARPRRHRPAAARRRQPVGPAQGAALLELRPLRLQDPGRHGRRQLRPLPRPHGRDARVGARSSTRRSTGCPRATTSRPTASTRCRRGTSWRPRWRR